MKYVNFIPILLLIVCSWILCGTLISPSISCHLVIISLFGRKVRNIWNHNKSHHSLQTRHKYFCNNFAQTNDAVDTNRCDHFGDQCKWDCQPIPTESCCWVGQFGFCFSTTAFEAAGHTKWTICEEQWCSNWYVFRIRFCHIAFTNIHYVAGHFADVDVDYQENLPSRIFVTIPRFTTGIPVTLGYVAGPGNLIQPYPSYAWHESHGRDCDGITSVFRIAVRMPFHKIHKLCWVCHWEKNRQTNSTYTGKGYCLIMGQFCRLINVDACGC